MPKIRIKIDNLEITTKAVGTYAPRSFSLDKKFEKKLANLGAPEIWVDYLDSEGYTESIQLVPADESGKLTAQYDPETQSIKCQVDGTFELETFEGRERYENLLSKGQGSIIGILLNTENGRELKFPKDEYGMANPVQVPVLNGDSDKIDIFLTAEFVED